MEIADPSEFAAAFHRTRKLELDGNFCHEYKYEFLIKYDVSDQLRGFILIAPPQAYRTYPLRTSYLQSNCILHGCRSHIFLQHFSLGGSYDGFL
jgi:hypothetical protein